MDNLGRVIYMACFALMFIVASSTSIYLYGTLNNYLNISTNLVSVEKRAEGVSIDDTKKSRDITRAEIYVTLYNMDQMHVDELHVDDYVISKNDVSNSSINPSLLRFLRDNPNKKYTYSSSYIASQDKMIVSYVSK